MDTKENLLESDGRFPSLFLVEDRKADGARRIDIGVEQRRDEFAYKERTLISRVTCPCWGNSAKKTYTWGASWDILQEGKKRQVSYQSPSATSCVTPRVATYHLEK